MRNDKDEAFILRLQVACQSAEQNGFHHTKQALLAILAREVGQTNDLCAHLKTGEYNTEDTSFYMDPRPLKYQCG